MIKASFQMFVALCIGLSVSAFAKEKRAPKEWAFLIFLNGHNNLAEFGDLNLNQLEKIGSTPEIDVLVQWAKLGFDNTYRLRVEKDNDETKVTSPLLQTLPRTDMGDYRELVEFVRWAHENYPAKRYFVSFWDHGSGWHLDRDKKPTRGVSHDDYSGNYISTEQMGIAMREIAAIIGHKVDIVGADACLMAMVEVGSEMADSAMHFVASEELEPGLGWPYDDFLEKWATNPYGTNAEITRYLVETYYAYLSPTEEITLSAFDLTEMPRLWSAMRLVSDAVLRLPEQELIKLKKGTESALQFYYRDYVDMGDWFKKAAASQGLLLEPKLLAEVKETIATMVTANKASPTYAAAQGMAFWVPPTKEVYDEYAAAYAALRFDRETGWGEAVARLLDLPVCARHADGQWAKTVLGFSSEYGPNGWSAAQATGACNTAGYGDKNTAWTPRVAQGSDEFLSLGFETSVHASGAIIRETYGNGFVTRVEAIDTDGNSHVVWEGEDSSPLGQVADFEVTWPETDYLVKGLTIHVTTRKHPGVWKEIDSVQLIGR